MVKANSNSSRLFAKRLTNLSSLSSHTGPTKILTRSFFLISPQVGEARGRDLTYAYFRYASQTLAHSLISPATASQSISIRPPIVWPSGVACLGSDTLFKLEVSQLERCVVRQTRRTNCTRTVIISFILKFVRHPEIAE